MNYQRIYDEIVMNGKNRKLEGYKENHHILPSSLGGTNDPNNLVYLTAREHFVAHRLLVKIYKDNLRAYKKMVYAFWWLCKQKSGERKVSSRAYECARILFSINNPQKCEERKARVKANREAGLYKYDYVSGGKNLSKTLQNFTKEQMIERMKPAHSANKEHRALAIRKGKSSQLMITTKDSIEIIFYSYDDVRAITGYSYDSIKHAIRTKSGNLPNGSKVQYIIKYKQRNRWTLQDG